MGIFGIHFTSIFTEKFIESSSTFVRLSSRPLNLINCQGRQKVEYVRNILKDLRRNHMVDEADTLQAWYCPSSFFLMNIFFALKGS